MPYNKQSTSSYTPKKTKNRTFHRENCDTFIRKSVIDIYGRHIILGGQHAFEWSITICTKESITTFKYPNGTIARKEFQKYTKKR